MELVLIKKMVAEGISPSKLSINESMFSDEDAKKVWKFVSTFYSKYEKLPDLHTITAETGVSFDGVMDPVEPVGFYTDQVWKKHRVHVARNFVKRTHSIFERTVDPDQVADEWRAGLRKLQEGVSRVVWDSSEESDREQIKAEYERLKELKGKTPGIETPWPMINELTGGIYPGHFISIVARSETGKSWMLVKMAVHAQKTGRRVLFVSPEMSHEMLRYRYAAVWLGLPYNKFRKGLLSHEDETRLFEFVKNPPGPQLIIADATAVQNAGQIADLVADYRPDLVIVDSYYLLDVEGRYGAAHERREALTIDLYNQAKRSKIPYAVSTHFNAKVDQEKKGTQEDVAYTKQIYRLSDLALALFRDEDMDSNKVILLRIFKQREGVKADVLLDFDFDRMSFHQLEVQNSWTEFGGSSAGVPPQAAQPVASGTEESPFKPIQSPPVEDPKEADEPDMGL